MKGVLAGATLPSPEASFFKYSTVKRSDVNFERLLDEIRRYRRWLSFKEEDWAKRLSNRVWRGKVYRRSIANEATIIIRGRERERLTIVIPCAPGSFYSLLASQRDQLNYFFERNALPFQASPGQQRLWLLPVGRIGEFFGYVRRIDRVIGELNALILDWKNEALASLKDLDFSEHITNAVGSLKPLHPVYWRVYPITLTLVEELPAELSTEIRKSVARGVLDSMFYVVRPLFRDNKKVDQAQLMKVTERIVRIAEELGFGDLARDFVSLISDAARKGLSFEHIEPQVYGLSERLATLG